MSVTNYTTAQSAADALVNAAIPQGITTSFGMSARELPLSILANMLNGEIAGQTLVTGAGAGITGGTGTIIKNSVVREGEYIKTTILIDLTGLESSATDLDIIGQGTSPAYLGRITDEQNGVIIGGFMDCLEVPAGGADDIDLYVASEATGKFDDAITGLTETVVVTSGGAWTLGERIGLAPDAIIQRSYLYLVAGEGAAAGTYTAGRYLLTLYGIPL